MVAQVADKTFHTARQGQGLFVFGQQTFLDRIYAYQRTGCLDPVHRTFLVLFRTRMVVGAGLGHNHRSGQSAFDGFGHGKGVVLSGSGQRNFRTGFAVLAPLEDPGLVQVVQSLGRR